MNEESKLQLERYFQLVNRRKFVLAIPIVLAVVGAALLSLLTTPVYTATATLRVDIAAAGVDVQDPNAAARFVETQSRIIKTRDFLRHVIEDLNLQTTPKKLADKVGTKPIPGTELVKVTANAGRGA